ncbi:MAG: hypothetical protein ACRYFX_05725 [Janthinobacterium lividum]
MESQPIPQLNPFGLAEGTTCDTIRIRYQLVGRPLEEVIVSLPLEVAPHMEGAATEAYLQAKAAGLLTAGMMAVCQFFYLDSEQNAWMEFDPADC